MYSVVSLNHLNYIAEVLDVPLEPETGFVG